MRIGHRSAFAWVPGGRLHSQSHEHPHRALAAACAAALLLAAGGARRVAVARAARPSPDSGRRRSGRRTAPLPVPPVPPRLAEGARYEQCLAMLTTIRAARRLRRELDRGHGGGDGAGALPGAGRGRAGRGRRTAPRCSTRWPARARRPGRRACRGLRPGGAGLADGGRAGARRRRRQPRRWRWSPDDADLLIDRAVAAVALDRSGRASTT